MRPPSPAGRRHDVSASFFSQIPPGTSGEQAMTVPTADVEYRDYPERAGLHRPRMAVGGRTVRLRRLRAAAQGQATAPVTHGSRTATYVRRFTCRCAADPGPSCTTP